MRYLFFTALICTLTTLSFGALENESSKKALYLENYREIAVQQMNKYGIPASITLAQGMLESGYGESVLAKKSNNHFGIKCHSSWTGATTYANDDKPNECFRVYASVADSYEDHSLFLINNKRYASLFLLDKKD
ncbi:MAG: glycoside hydrolase family 73 protein, partial [Bacteroidota bacterium]